MNWLDIVFVLIMGLSVLHGLRTGLIGGMAKITGLITGVAVAYYSYGSLALYLSEQWGWGESIATFLLEKLPLPVLQGLVGGGLQSLSAGPGETVFFSSLTQQLALFVLEIASFIFILIIISKLVAMLLKIISGVALGTPFGPLDRAGGLLMGFARGLLIVFVLVFLTQPFTMASTQAGTKGNNIIENVSSNSVLLPYFTDTLELLNFQFTSSPSFTIPLESRDTAGGAKKGSSVAYTEYMAYKYDGVIKYAY